MDRRINTMPSMQVMSVRRFRIGRASELIGIERWRLKAWAAKGWVPCDKTKGNHLLFSINDIKEIRGVVEFNEQSGTE
jgi:DNA-binding transcriptional MerR regulator